MIISQIITATGAIERPLSFAGHDIPGVCARGEVDHVDLLEPEPQPVPQRHFAGMDGFGALLPEPLLAGIEPGHAGRPGLGVNRDAAALAGEATDAVHQVGECALAESLDGHVALQDELVTRHRHELGAPPLALHAQLLQVDGDQLIATAFDTRLFIVNAVVVALAGAVVALATKGRLGCADEPVPAQ